MADLHFLANPARFRRFSQRVLPGVTLATVLSLGVGLYPRPSGRRPTISRARPCASCSCTSPGLAVDGGLRPARRVLGAALLVWRHPLAPLMAARTAPVGARFALHLPADRLAVGWPMWGRVLGVGRAAHRRCCCCSSSTSATSR